MQEDDNVEKEPDKTTPVPYNTRRRNDIIHMKILVPAGAVGAIIGKGGESIAQIQWETGSKIKLSKPNDFYPGTMERVCLIQGTLDGVTRMHNYIMDRMLEKPDCSGSSPTNQSATTTGSDGLGRNSFRSPQSAVPASCSSPIMGGATAAGGESLPVETSHTVWSSSPSGGRLPWGRHQQVKILVPNCTAGLVIGKRGSYVNEIKHRTGAFIQISQKSHEINLPERCITIAGEAEQCRSAVALVLSKIAADPQSTSCPTISYSRMQGPVASAYPTGSPFAIASIPAAFPIGPSTNPTLFSHGIDWNTAAMSDPYISSLFQTSLLQAAALALNQRTAGGFYQSQVTGQAGSQQATVPGTVGSSGRSDVGLYAQQPNTSQLLSTISQLGWTHTTPENTSWAPSSDSQLSGTAAGTPVEHTYPWNLAYYTPTQPVLAQLPSRHPSEAFHSTTEFYNHTAYPASLLPYANPSGCLRVTSSSIGATASPPVYPSIFQSPLGATTSDYNALANQKLVQPPSAMSLGDLFNTIRLSGSSLPDSVGDLNPLFSPTTAAVNPTAFVNLAGAYSLLPSPTALGTVLSTTPAIEPSSSHVQQPHPITTSISTISVQPPNSTPIPTNSQPIRSVPSTKAERQSQEQHEQQLVSESSAKLMESSSFSFSYTTESPTPISSISQSPSVVDSADRPLPRTEVQTQPRIPTAAIELVTDHSTIPEPRPIAEAVDNNQRKPVLNGHANATTANGIDIKDARNVP